VAARLNGHVIAGPPVEWTEVTPIIGGYLSRNERVHLRGVAYLAASSRLVLSLGCRCSPHFSLPL